RRAPAWDSRVSWSAAQKGALGLSFEVVGELAPGAREQAGHLLLGLAMARFDQAIQEAAQQPTLALGRMLGDLSRVLGRIKDGGWERGEGRKGGCHGVLLRRLAHLCQA